MALQVWLPLNGTLENQGLDNITFTQTTVSGYEAGKIGQALQILNSNVFFTAPSLTDAKIFSVAFWYKAISDSSITANWRRVLSFDTKNADGTAGSLFRFESSYGLTTSYALSIHNNTSQSLGSIGHSIIDLKDEWHHVCFTHTPEQNLTYLDGVLKTTGTGAAGTIDSTIRISDTSAGTDPKGLMNDLRIYDHCLSQKEVKELSKGLVGHWPLNDGVGGENLLPKSLASAENYSSTGLATGHTSVVTEDGYTCYKCGTGNSSATSMVFTWGNGVKLDANTTYTYSYWLKSNTAGSFNFTSFGHFQVANDASTASDKTHEDIVANRVYSPSSIEANKWTKMSITFTTNSLDDSIFRHYPKYNLGTGVIVYIRDQKLEKGSTATPWIPAPTDALYSKMGLDSGIVYDTSGYGRNGSISANAPTADSDSPRYQCSMAFNGSNNFIMLGREAMVRDAITVSWWGYMDTWSSYGRSISCTEGGGWNFEPSSGKMSFAVGTGESSNTYKNVATSTAILTTLSSGWHMFTGTYDGLASKIYVDGVLQGTNNAYTTKTPLFYNASNGIFIGAEAAGTTTTPTAPYFNGKISDVRIYATALSADDIKELYEVSASVDNTGNLWAYEVNEA